MSWGSATTGWVMGAGHCGKVRCAEVAGTTNGGKTWTFDGKVGARVATSGEPGVNEIRFAPDGQGWAFGTVLRHTTDGGRVWHAQAIPGKGRQVLSMALGSTDAYAVTSPCAVGTGTCNSTLSLWRAKLRGGAWQRVKVQLPGGIGASLSAWGKSVYLVAPDSGSSTGTSFYASTNGTTFTPRPTPCSAKRDLYLIQTVPTSATKVDLLCDGNPGLSKAVKTVYRSGNTAKTDTSAGTMGLLGISADLAASPSGNLAVAAASDGSFIYINDGKAKGWHMAVGLGDGGEGWNDLAYVSNTTAWVVHAPSNVGTFNTGGLMVTHNAGHTWSAVTL